MRKNLVSIFLLFVSAVCWAQQLQPLPIDKNVRKGVLPNGLTYYIRHNSLPENRADFYIAQKVGSMMEEDNQAGLAHFLEHMAFNGTTNFPDKKMLNYLEHNGVKFGTNVNAYTSFDETVYNISDVPTTNPRLIDSCLLVLYDWSNGITLKTEEIDKERGVIREEWRTRGGAQQRILEKMLPIMYKDSKYANRMPIGNIDIINNFKPEEIRSYYKKWYRPDLQAIIIVGDIDADKMEAKVKDLFGKIPAAVNPAKREYYDVPNNKEPVVGIVTDPEATRTQIIMAYKHEVIPQEVKESQAGLLVDYLKSAAAQMMNQRFSEITQKPNAPFIMAGAYDGNYLVAKTKDAWTVFANAEESKIKDAVAALIRETERMKRFGFTASEYARTRENILKEYENAYNNREKVENNRYVQEYVDNFINYSAIPGIEYEYNTLKTMAPSIPVEAVNQMVKQLVGEDNLIVMINGPQKEGLTYPTEKEILPIISQVKAEKIEAYNEEVSNEPLIQTPPTPGKISKIEKNDQLGTTVWTLENGMKVVLKQTNFKDDEIMMVANSVGGYSQYLQSETINAKNINSVANLGGVGSFSATNLVKALAGKNATARPTINLTTQGFTGSSSIKDFETMLQLVYLYFTSPRMDNDAFKAYIQRSVAQLKNLEAEPMVAFSDNITKAMYGDNPLVRRMKVEDIEKIDYQRTMEMYKQLFINPGSFTFTFVGNIDEAKVKPVVEQYLASLKGQAVKGEFLKVPMDLVKGKQNNVFQREMKTPKASVFDLFSGKMDRNLKNTITMSILDQIMDIVYTEKIREDEGGTYGVSTRGSIARYPENQTTLEIFFDTDPAKAEKLNGIAKRELAEIAKNGPRTADFNKVKEYMVKAYNEKLKENNYWLGVLNTKYFYNEDYHSDYLKTLNSITANDVKSLVNNLLSQGNEAVVVMMPKEAAKQ